MQFSSLQRMMAAAALAGFASLSGAAELLVSNYFGDNVGRYDLAGGGFLGSLSGGTLDGPLSTRLGPDGLVYVASELTGTVVRYNATTGAYVSTFAIGVNSPNGVTFDASGNMLVSNFDTDSVSKYTSGGAFSGVLVGPGSGGLDGPDVGTVVGPDGLLYVPSFYGNSILRYNATTGAFLGAFVSAGSGGLTQPRTILFRDNKVWVTSDSGNKVLRYNLDGSFLDTFVTPGSGGLLGASGMAFDDNGFLYVSSWRNNLVLRYSATTGAFSNVFISSGLSGPTFLSTVPEPCSFVAMGAGLALLVRRRRYRKG